ncbi:hypothetical protein MBLNU230_g5190t1 [Neophaeotheca triangularis]
MLSCSPRATLTRHGISHHVIHWRPKASLRAPLLPTQGHRHIQTATVTDADIVRLASTPLHPLTLADLCSHGRPPLSTASLLDSANFTLSILPSRLAHRIQSIRALPYIVVANPNVSRIHANYVHSLSTLLPYAERSGGKRIETLEEEVQFTEVMADLVNTHSNTISILARGFLEARKYIGKAEVTRFLDEHLRARIGTRLIAEQHIALHFSSQAHSSDSQQQQPVQDSSYIGVIDTALKPANIIRSCEATVGEICELKYGVRPSVEIIGSPETTMAHIPMHLEYVLTELLKNSFRATIEAGMEKEAIQVTIAPAPATGEQTSRSSDKPDGGEQGLAEHTEGVLSSGEHQGAVAGGRSGGGGGVIRALDKSTPGVTIRLRDRGGGIAPEVYRDLWEYGFTTFNEDEIHDKTSGGGGGGGMNALDLISGGAGGGSSLAGLGYGLPLGRAYAEYFGGGIAVQSLWGWGTDVYVSLRGVGRV